MCDDDLKICSVCYVEKPIDDFYVDRARGKHRSRCKACDYAASSRYAREHRQPSPRALRRLFEQESGKRLCVGCNQILPTNSFRARANGKRTYRCRDCTRETNRIKKKEAGLSALERQWRATIKYKYNLTADGYRSLLNEQGGVCAICGIAPPRRRSLVVDHCHDTGRIRGLLCAACNSGLGLLQDDPNVIMRAIDYLDRANVGASHEIVQ